MLQGLSLDITKSHNVSFQCSQLIFAHPERRWEKQRDHQDRPSREWMFQEKCVLLTSRGCRLNRLQRSTLVNFSSNTSTVKSSSSSEGTMTVIRVRPDCPSVSSLSPSGFERKTRDTGLSGDTCSHLEEEAEELDEEAELVAERLLRTPKAFRGMLSLVAEARSLAVSLHISIKAKVVRNSGQSLTRAIFFLVVRFHTLQICVHDISF